MISSFPLIGSFVAAYVIPDIFEHHYPNENGFYYAHINGFWVCLVCFGGILILCALDKYVENYDDAWLLRYVQ